MQEKLKNVWRKESTLIITFQVTEENEADQTALEENYPSIGDPKEIGQAHNMFFHESSKKTYKFFLIFTMAIGVVEFSNGGYKIRKIFA